ncbi:sialidase [Clostridium sp. YIM B02505]|uniref:Sialidase n=1 Tax=Clostridium yunnanense TaxID=2800325 RepID=A0ABS1EKH6_9CLOT|nr:sialidase [Clostridium yunnanense]MBK1809868.1 sialidase [Clostridium yunnanense]
MDKNISNAAEILQNEVNNSNKLKDKYNFGENVYIFDESMPKAYIQDICDKIFKTQEANHFGEERYAIFFKPGSYEISMKVGFYTQVAGLGEKPYDVNVTGAVEVNAAWRDGNALCNFWRTCENISITPTDGVAKWAVSQASPLRRVYIKGDLTLYDGGWSSGGFLADSLIEGEIISGTQQQWFSRNNEFKSWDGSSYNMFFVGDVNPPEGQWPEHPFTKIESTPIMREKPFLMIDDDGDYKVFVPEFKSETKGITWKDGKVLGKKVSLENFYIAHPNKSSARDINYALEQGKNILFTPGIYHIDETIEIKKKDTIILGIGIATLLADKGSVTMSIDDVEGVIVSGLLFDAGVVESPLLLEVGKEGAANNNSSNPIVLSDLFFRVGGADIGRAEVCLKINSDYVIGDHFWVWRADHGKGVSWDTNITSNGVIVNGNDVTLYALMVEHFHKYQTIWNGERGKTYFYQSEIPYDAPNQDRWMNGKIKGYASYKVSDKVNSHEAYGIGVYSYIINQGIKLDRAIEVPDKKGVKIKNAVTIYLSGHGGISNIINEDHKAVNRINRMSRCMEYSQK